MLVPLKTNEATCHSNSSPLSCLHYLINFYVYAMMINCLYRIILGILHLLWRQRQGLGKICRKNVSFM